MRTLPEIAASIALDFVPPTRSRESARRAAALATCFAIGHRFVPEAWMICRPCDGIVCRRCLESRPGPG